MRELRWVVGLLFLCGCGSADGMDPRMPEGALPTSPPAVAASYAGMSGGFDNAPRNASSSVPLRAADAGAATGNASACPATGFCASTNPDKGCGTFTVASTVKTTVTPGNVLVIFDRSLSMIEPFDTQLKWEAAGSALVGALMPLADSLTIGVVTFPSDNLPASCTVEPIDSADQIALLPGPMAIDRLKTGAGGSPMYQPGLGLTPTAEAVQAADQALAGASLEGTTVVVLLTDGEPNCAWDEQQTVSTVTNWRSQKNIKTYVIGLPGVVGTGPTLLTEIAQAGGTDDYLTPADGATLQQKLSEIVSQTVSSGIDSCAIDLTPPTNSPDKLQLVVEEPSAPGMLENVPHDLGTAGGWTISGDGAHVMLQGPLCDHARAGRFSKLTFQFGCKDIPVLPAAHVM